MVTDRVDMGHSVTYKCSHCGMQSIRPCRDFQKNACPHYENKMELMADQIENKIKSDGGSTDYYKIPAGASDLIDLIEHKKMSFALGNIFKACYRLGEKEGNDLLYDLNKIIYFAERLKTQVENNR